MIRPPLYRTLVVCAVAVGLACHTAQAQTRELTAESVRQAIQRGMAYLKQQQDQANGTWRELPDYEGGVTALCTLALLNAGVGVDDPTMQRALQYLRSLGSPSKRSKTYCVALRTMVLCAAEPQRDMVLIRKNAAWLEGIQLKTGDFNGSWTYGDGLSKKGDKSNSQFALLALHEAERVGVKVDETTWRRAEDYWRREQHPDGSWSYTPSAAGSSGSMTCAGISSLAITSGRLSRGDAQVDGEEIRCCGEQDDNAALQRGLDWMGRNFAVRRNPSINAQIGRAWHLYYLYGVERAGRLTGRRFLGPHDWYREGAEYLLSQQNQLTGAWQGSTYVETSPDIATAFALLFLAKGRRPLLIAKLRRDPDDDWNYHRSDLANLTRYVESRWQKDMTWQVIDIRAAGVEDLLHTPVLFVTGRDGLALTAQQKTTLRGYLDNGGFLFAEACCNGKGFDRDFRQLMKELFPDNPLRLLPPEHPVWYAEEKVDADDARPLWGIDACCRTSVVYCPQDLSCHWELANVSRGQDYPESVSRRIAAAKAIGANVLAYATNRELREKLDIQQLLPEAEEDSSIARATLRIAKLRHGGGSDDAPAALTNLLRMFEYHVGLPVGLQRRHISATDKSLPNYPILFTHGRRAFRWTEREREGLRRFLSSGGVLMGDAICANPAFFRSFQAELSQILPNQTWQRIPPTHPVFTSEFGGYDLSTVTVRDPQLRSTGDAPLRATQRQTTPWLEGLEMDGRYVVIFSPLDMSCALENHAALDCKGYVREDAAKLGINIILYALQ